MSNSSAPAGWHDDGTGTLRWWDGAQWTQHTHVPQTVDKARPSTAASQFARNLVQKDDPSTDPGALWSAVGKPVTGIGGGRYKLTEEYLYFERGTLSTRAQQIRTHEIHDVDANQTMTQKARGVGTIVLFSIRSTGARERVELIDVENFREGVSALNRVSHEARERLRTKQQTQHVNYSGFHPTPTSPAHSTPSVDAAPKVDLNNELARLVAFKDQGVLDDEEFAAAKRKLLGL
ncbi:PH domain-containing protein [Gordonia soli]|uniref:DUF2510 domain-containing protein n=1 Tax=Gordonia soli NBRC 108243 TaxID=1223545 RepID=M0QLL8_9ACTN|nr:PH domain-containing protein [Gordonia soli]GAC69201.1 hypothetical protein GS4_22_00330 [Gordonia soli NBRC 108243]